MDCMLFFKKNFFFSQLDEIKQTHVFFYLYRNGSLLQVLSRNTSLVADTEV